MPVAFNATYPRYVEIKFYIFPLSYLLGECVYHLEWSVPKTHKTHSRSNHICAGMAKICFIDMTFNVFVVSFFILIWPPKWDMFIRSNSVLEQISVIFF